MTTTTTTTTPMPVTSYQTLPLNATGASITTIELFFTQPFPGPPFIYELILKPSAALPLQGVSGIVNLSSAPSGSPGFSSTYGQQCSLKVGTQKFTDILNALGNPGLQVQLVYTPEAANPQLGLVSDLLCSSFHQFQTLQAIAGDTNSINLTTHAISLNTNAISDGIERLIHTNQATLAAVRQLVQVLGGERLQMDTDPPPSMDSDAPPSLKADGAAIEAS